MSGQARLTIGIDEPVALEDQLHLVFLEGVYRLAVEVVSQERCLHDLLEVAFSPGRHDELEFFLPVLHVRVTVF